MRRRCSKCDINYPADSSFSTCQVCEGHTISLAGEHDLDHEVRVQALQAKQLSIEARKMILWRRRNLVRMGFLGAMLDLLTESPVDLHKLEDLIKSGCSPDTAARIEL